MQWMYVWDWLEFFVKIFIVLFHSSPLMLFSLLFTCSPVSHLLISHCLFKPMFFLLIFCRHNCPTSPVFPENLGYSSFLDPALSSLDISFRIFGIWTTSERCNITLKDILYLIHRRHINIFNCIAFVPTKKAV